MGSPASASTCWKARMCSGSVSAITPSKSKTMAKGRVMGAFPGLGSG